MVSVGPTTYGGGWQDIPLGSLLTALGHCGPVLRSDTDVPDGATFVEIEFEAETGVATEVVEPSGGAG